MDATDWHEVLRRHLAGMFSVLVGYCVSFNSPLSTYAVMTFSLTGFRTVRQQPAFTSAVGTPLLSHRDLPPILVTL